MKLGMMFVALSAMLLVIPQSTRSAEWSLRQPASVERLVQASYTQSTVILPTTALSDNAIKKASWENSPTPAAPVPEASSPVTGDVHSVAPTSSSCTSNCTNNCDPCANSSNTCVADYGNCIPDCNMCPCFYAYVEGLIWERVGYADNQPLVLDLNTNQTLMSVGDLDSDWNGGFRTVVGVPVGCGYTLEVGYFGLYDQLGTAFVSGTNNLRLPGDLGLSVNNFFGDDEVESRYEANLNNVEVNLLCCCCCCDCCGVCSEYSPIIGFRYLNLDEQLRLRATDFQEGTSVYDVDTNNNLFGAQIGARYRRCYGRWSWETTGKAGIYGNAAEQQQAPIIDFPNVLVRPATSTTDGEVAFVGDLNFTLIYQLSSVWGIRSGYNLLWVDGVALAPDQLDFTNTPTSGTDIDTSGCVFYHGVSFGLEARW